MRAVRGGRPKPVDGMRAGRLTARCMLPITLVLGSAAARALPPRLDRPLAQALGSAWSVLDRQRAKAVRANRSALGADYPLNGPFAAWIEALLSWLRLLGLPRAEIVRRTTFEGVAALTNAARERGAVVLVAHVGEWEWGAAAVAATGLPLTTVAGTQMSPRFSRALERAKKDLGLLVVGPDVSPRRLVKILREGGVVGLLVDGDVASGRAPACVAGQAVTLPLGAAWLVSHTGAALFSGRCERDPVRGPGFYRAHLEALDAPEGMDRLHGAVAAWLEGAIAENPGRWCIFRPFFAQTDRIPAPAPPANALPSVGA